MTHFLRISRQTPVEAGVRCVFKFLSAGAALHVKIAVVVLPIHEVACWQLLRVCPCVRSVRAVLACHLKCHAHSQHQQETRAVSQLP
jgi:hypothetical protein